MPTRTGRKLTYNTDIGQRPQTLSGTSPAGTTTPYVQQVIYWPQGSIYVWQYGNNVYPVESYTTNLQPSLNYSTYQNNSSYYQLYLQTNWNNNGTVGGGVECYGPNVTNTNMSCLSSVYGYDPLNRLTSATDGFYQNPSSGSGCTRNFQYDEYGNMSVASNGSNTPLSGLTPMANQSPFNSANNMLVGSNYAYDARGNLTKAGAVTMSYDAENKLIQTIDGGTHQTTTFTYDASGNRVQKVVTGGATIVDVHTSQAS